MSTVKAINFQHPSASAANITLASDGTVSGGIPSPNRNLLYNGAMQVSQRGTSTASITTSGYYTADRWATDVSSLGTWTQSTENDAPTGSGFRKSLKVLCTTADASPAAGDLLAVDQLLEGQDLQRIAKGTSSAQQLTLSFWVKSNVTGTYICNLYDNDNTRSVSASYTITASATWEKKTITFPADTTGAFDNDNALSLYVVWWLGAGTTYTSGTLNTTWQSATSANRAVGQTNLAAATNNYWQVTGVQLEVGSQATAFEFKSFGQELRECQRYYQLIASGIDKPICMAALYFSNQAYGVLPLLGPMRGAKTLSITTGTNYYRLETNNTGDVINSLTLGQESDSSVRVQNTTEVASTTGHAGWFITNNAAAFVAIVSEL